MNDKVDISRDEHGIIHVMAVEETDRCWGLGHAHATDRAMQMLFMRILGRGELSKYLDGSDDALAIDTFFRKMNWGRDLDQVGALTPRARAACEAYVRGINDGLKGRVPWELRVAGYKKLEPWTIDDIFLLGRMVSYLTLAQSQGEMERLFVQMVQMGVDRKYLEELFPGCLEGLDEALLKKVHLVDRIVPESVKWATGGVRMMASNNWVVAPGMTKSGKAMLANDPHLEVNRLPSVWYEIVLEGGDDWMVTATMPGLPAGIISRTKNLAWGVTYTFMDCVDSWIEHCKDGKFRRGDEWHAFTRREEVIERKKRAPAKVTFLENDHGVLEGDPTKHEYLLATRWSGGQLGARTINAFVEMLGAKDVATGQKHLGALECAFNWVLADSDGNIGFQMSGLMPKRRAGWRGFVPMPGWESENDWQGWVDPTDLPRLINPEAGFFCTANQNLNAHGNVAPLNLNQGAYRSDRIDERLRGRSDLTVDDMFEIQLDLHSRHAEIFIEALKPYLPDTPEGRALLDWDLRYDLDSTEASTFEAIYRALLRGVFGRHLGEQVVEFLWDGTGMFADFFVNFDEILLSEDAAWFDGDKAALFQAAVTTGLAQPKKPWRDGRSLSMAHMLFGGKLPRWLGFDHGPFDLAGGRGSPQQGQIYESAGRVTSFAPSIRFVTDFGETSVHTRLMGGVSDRRWSGRYANEVEDWLNGTYKRVKPGHSHAKD